MLFVCKVLHSTMSSCPKVCFRIGSSRRPSPLQPVACLVLASIGMSWQSLSGSVMVLPCSRRVVSCIVSSFLVSSCLLLSCLAFKFPVRHCLVLSCLVLSCGLLHDLSCLVFSCVVLSVHKLSYPVWSCLVLSCLWYCLVGSGNAFRLLVLS